VRFGRGSGEQLSGRKKKRGGEKAGIKTDEFYISLEIHLLHSIGERGTKVVRWVRTIALGGANGK